MIESTSSGSVSTSAGNSQCVLKIGGSLYDLPDLAERLHELAQLRPHGVLFPGGGGAADLVRDWHLRFQLTEDAAHELAIASLNFNARLLATLLPTALLVRQQSDPWCPSTLKILEPEGELRRLEQRHPDQAPPHIWDVTSDSLAAWIAHCWHVAEFVLVKSVGLPVHGLTATQAMSCHWIDPFCPGLLGHIPRVSWCNLRETPITIQPWLEYGRSIAAD